MSKTYTYISIIAGILVAAATTLSPDVQAFWGSHPQIGAIVTLIWGVLAHYAPSPKS